MPKAKIYKLPSGQEIEVDVVEITGRNDPPAVIELADGSRLRLRIDVLEVGRVREEWDVDGNPVYHIKSANTMAVLDAPESLQKKKKTASNGQS